MLNYPEAMLRTIFVLAIMGIGFVYAFQGAIYSLMFYLWIAYFRPEQWVWDPWVRSISLSWIAGVATVAAALVSKKRWPVNVRVVLLALFLLQSLLSAMASTHSPDAWPHWIEFAKTIAITYLIVVLTPDVSTFRLVLMVIGLSLGFEAAKQGWVGLLTHPGETNTNDLPLLGDNNGIAVGMLMLVPILTTLAATATGRSERMMFRFLAFGTVYRAIATYSRGGFIACAALGAVYLFRSKRRLLASLAVAVSCLMIAPVMPTQFWDRMRTIDDASDNSSLGRLHFWRVAVAMANDNPLLGVGHDAYNATYDKYDSSHGDFGSARSVHSIWFGSFAELGYPGLVLFAAQLLLAFRAAARARAAARRIPGQAHLQHYAFGLEGALVAFVVGGSFVPMQYNEMAWHVIGLTISLDGLARAALDSRQVSPPAVEGAPVAGVLQGVPA